MKNVGKKTKNRDGRADISYLWHTVVDDERLSGCSGTFGDERLVQNLLLDSQQLGDGGHDGRVLDRHRLVVIVRRFLRLELEIADVQDGRQDGKDAPLGLAAEANKLHRLFEPGQLVALVTFVQIVVVALSQDLKKFFIPVEFFPIQFDPFLPDSSIDTLPGVADEGPVSPGARSRRASDKRRDSFSHSSPGSRSSSSRADTFARGPCQTQRENHQKAQTNKQTKSQKELQSFSFHD